VAPERQLGSDPAGEATTVPCPGCGREYDTSLFAFGRTRHCTCGTRVGLAVQSSAADPASSPRFFADAMLGRLARWLRILGYDTSYEAHVEDAALVRRAVQEKRVILTRDRALPEEFRVPALVLVEAERPAEQLRELVTRLGLDTEGRLFTRCSRCNAELEPVPRSQIAERVPARVLRDHERFKHCPGCGRVYWEGSHVDRIRSAIRRALAS
jgi:uncharacterized protein with PIN domain